MKKITKRVSLKFLILLTIFVLSACNGSSPEGRTFVWIDVPLDGLSFPDVQSIKIEGHATSSGGVSRVEIWIDGALLTTISDPPTDGQLANFYTEWTPPGLGDYVIQAVAYGADGEASLPDSARVTFGDTLATPVSTVTPVDTVTPVVTETFTPTSPPDVLIQFWAEPPEIQAGACTTIRWHAENVSKVIFGGAEQDFDGSYQDCLCENERYTLTVLHLDNTEEKRTVDIIVSGGCETPTSLPPQDTMPPPAPSPVVPANGLSIACKSSQSLVWLPVSDESGIAEYQVQVQRHSGDNNWQDVPGSVFGGISGKQLNVNVECGWYYRWRVRAVDGAGNTGSWSNWSLFSIILG